MVDWVSIRSGEDALYNRIIFRFLNNLYEPAQLSDEGSYRVFQLDLFRGGISQTTVNQLVELLEGGFYSVASLIKILKTFSIDFIVNHCQYVLTKRGERWLGQSFFNLGVVLRLCEEGEPGGGDGEGFFNGL